MEDFGKGCSFRDRELGDEARTIDSNGTGAFYVNVTTTMMISMTIWIWQMVVIIYDGAE